MGCGFAVMMVHTLRRRMFSMAPSTQDLPIRPGIQYRPVPIPNRTAAASTMRISLTISALPISMEVYLAGSAPRCRCRRWKHRYQTRWQRPVRAGTPRTPDPTWHRRSGTPEGYSHSQQDTKKGECKGGVDRPAHALDAQKDKSPSTTSTKVDDPHKAAHVDAGEQVCQQNR